MLSISFFVKVVVNVSSLDLYSIAGSCNGNCGAINVKTKGSQISHFDVSISI